MLPCSVLSRPAASSALVALVMVLGSRMCIGLAESRYLGDVQSLSGETREAQDEKTLDIGRLLFKQMRFRDLSPARHSGPGAIYPYGPYISRWLGYRPWNLRSSVHASKSRRRPHNKVLKRQNEQEKMMVGNLAALLSNMKSRDTSTQLRMPSLRFG